LRVIATDVLVAPAFDPAVTDQTTVPHEHFTAIWDTGATNTVITQKVVDACGLKPIGMTQTRTANGLANCEVYLINIVTTNSVGWSNIRVTKGDITGTDVLIGMDIITMGDFAITNKDGKTCFSFRTPSMQTIDFATTHAVHPHPVGRNDPCPCGSGSKYKKCHGAVSPPPAAKPPVPAPPSN
jgi:predicted aspartyl protease